MKLRPIYSRKFDHWVLCHDQPCEKGETSAVARLYGLDERLAQHICDRFNDHPNPTRYLEFVKEAFEL